MTIPTTRLAPSPTGALHLGNARTFLINWAIARQGGMRLVLRIEDLDTPRTKPGADKLVIEDLRWLGIDWDGEPMYQSRDLDVYRRALDALKQKGLVYPCTCTRAQIRAALSAPHKDNHETRYPGTCRLGEGCTYQVPSGPHAWRIAIPDRAIDVTDRFQGAQSFNVQSDVGDFVVATKVGLPAYQLAVVVDDHRQGVTHVVRGDDLLPSAARQLWCYRLMGLSPVPIYIHLPLVIGEDGRRLAKRHGDTRIAYYRECGVRPERIIGLVAKWSGIIEHYCELDARTFLERFDISRLPSKPIFMHSDDRQSIEG